ncbi:hypothetical protein HanIR_Chr10g0497081 [Helianthus annuus]|nr:hypothetical protein HanIR_Chr10g0497081 [Helianthus annuus]
MRKFLWFDCSMSLVENNRNVYLSYELWLFFKCFVIYGKGVSFVLYTDHVILLVICVSLVLVGLGCIT